MPGEHSRHAIPARNVVGHSDVAPTRKDDPGELFDWPRLASEGIGLWPKSAPNSAQITPYCAQTAPNSAQKTHGGALSDLTRYGYDTTDALKAITAFQRHFRPHTLNGIWDEQCADILNQLLTIG